MPYWCTNLNISFGSYQVSPLDNPIFDAVITSLHKVSDIGKITQNRHVSVYCRNSVLKLSQWPIVHWRNVMRELCFQGLNNEYILILKPLWATNNVIHTLGIKCCRETQCIAEFFSTCYTSWLNNIVYISQCQLIRCFIDGFPPITSNNSDVTLYTSAWT